MKSYVYFLYNMYLSFKIFIYKSSFKYEINYTEMKIFTLYTFKVFITVNQLFLVVNTPSMSYLGLT